MPTRSQSSFGSEAVNTLKPLVIWPEPFQTLSDPPMQGSTKTCCEDEAGTTFNSGNLEDLKEKQPPLPQELSQKLPLTPNFFHLTTVRLVISLLPPIL